MSTSRKVERRLTARSVLLSVLLGSDPPRLPALLLVRTTELFGIAEGTTRTALSRMAAAGEVTAHGGSYELTGTGLLRRQARQQESRAGRTTDWIGEWRQAVIGVDGPRPADERAAARADLAAHRFAELREGIWLRPDNLGGARRGTSVASDQEAVPMGRLASRERTPNIDGVTWFSTIPGGDPAAFAARLWDLRRWAGDAADLRLRMDGLVGALEDGDRDALADGFILSAAVLRHFQADPLLPAVLLPEGWPGDDLRSEYDRAYRSVLAGWFDEQR